MFVFFKQCMVANRPMQRQFAAGIVPKIPRVSRYVIPMRRSLPPGNYFLSALPGRCRRWPHVYRCIDVSNEPKGNPDKVREE
jgi:hypothetical protein